MTQLVVTCDTKADKHGGIVAIWEVGVEIKFNEDGMWGGSGSGFIEDMTPVEFEEKYGLEAPAPGERKVMITQYSWEEL